MDENTSIFLNKIQDITTTAEGIVKRSNNAIFKMDLETNIFEFDPFFEGLRETLATEEKIYYTFHCVNFIFKKKNFYCDLIIKKERGNFVILFFNYSNRYTKLQEIESHKNRTALRKHLENLNIEPGF